MRTFSLFFLLCLSALTLLAQRQISTLQVTGRNAYAQLDAQRFTGILPSGRRVTPVGKVVRITHDPFGLAVAPDGQTILTLHSGVVTLIKTSDPEHPLRIPAYDRSIPSILDGASFRGVAFASNSKTAYLSQGDRGKVVLFDLEKLTRQGSIDLDGSFNGVKYEDSFTSDLVLNPQKNELLVLDRGNFRLVRIDLTTKKITASIPTGRQPFSLALSPNHDLALVANVGLYSYPLVPGVTPENRDTMMLPFPPYGTFTPASLHGDTLADGRVIPGLGDPLHPDAMSVFAIDLSLNRVASIFKTGRQIGQLLEDTEIVGGASPNSIAVGRRYAYIANATNDLISILDLSTQKVVGEFPIQVDPRLDGLRGLMPFGLALSADESRLYVALLGFNAVAVIDPQSRQTLGLIPTGWGPAQVALAPNGQQLFITSVRGLGAGPNGGKGFVRPPQGTYIGDIQLATLQVVDIPSAATLAQYTRQCLENTFTEVMVPLTNNPLPPLPKASPSPIKHIVYITKENRTYDEVMGQRREQQARGDSTLARYGLNTTVINKKDTIKRADIMPNHHKIAQQWTFSDNFYCDSDASIHGHHWMMGVIPNEWVEANSSASGTFKPFSSAPGRRFPKATGAIDPEDYNEIGGLWEALERNNISFYNFGEGNEYAGVAEYWNHLEFGARQPVVFPLQKAVYPHTSRFYAGFDMDIPDQLRVDQFEKEFTEKWLRGKDTMPQFIALQLPNDHGAGVRPEAGFPYDHSFMADNDLALGRLLEFLSNTPYWKNTLVIITEDDPQGGVDHLDAHRSILLLAGPYVKRGYVSHTHANFGSLLKVIYNILGVPYVNHYDQTASLLDDCFTSEANLSPYRYVFPDRRIFDPTRAMETYEKNFQWSKRTGKKVTHLDSEAQQRARHYAAEGQQH